MTLYVATSNPGKLRDFRIAASALALAGQVTILPLPGLTDIPPPAEDELTFEGNAITKARFYSLHAPGEIVLADDSGLEVDVLDGAPGVRSARYAEDVAYPDIDSALPIDVRNNLTLIQALGALFPTSHSARYRCVVAAARDGKLLDTGSGTIEGEIVLAPRGMGGFGYDSLFYIPALCRTMAELDADTRLSMSHRGIALKALLSVLPTA
jgi:XTP/dITP diphosphohydrolase